MHIIDIHHKDAFALAMAEIHDNPIIVQFPTVFVLLAAPTAKGVEQLNKTKTRLDGKNYGTAIGSLEKFIAHAIPEKLPAEFRHIQDFEKMTGAFIRLAFRSESFQSNTIRNGTHQGVLLDGIYLALFKYIEASFEAYPPQQLWDYKNYCAPLCTSCNISGDAGGSIIALNKALHFAETRGIRLMITGETATDELGSYPILGFEKHKVTIHREGPRLNQFKQKIPLTLRTW